MNSVKNVPLFVVFLFLSFSIFAHEIPNYSIKERVAKADLVFEGEVVKVESFFLGRGKLVFTRNFIAIDKIFKGVWSKDTLIVYTRGGMIDDYFALHGHDASLSKGERGVFMCTQNTYKHLRRSGIDGYKLLYEQAGFVKYTENKVGVKAIDGEVSFKSLDVLSDSILVVTRQPVLYHRNDARFTETTCDSLMDSGIDIAIKNAQITSDVQDTYLEFDVTCRVDPNGLRLGEAELYITYPSDVLGGSLVQGGKVDIQKDQVLLDSIYSLTYSDSSSSVIKITIEDSGADGDFYPLTVVYEKLFHVKLTVDDISSILALNADNFQLTGDVKYACDRGMYSFRKINIDDSVKLIDFNPSSPVALTYTFENLELVESGNSIWIDVYVSSATPTLFAGGYIEVTFNQNALELPPTPSWGFGFERGEVINDNILYPADLSSSSPNTVKIRIDSDQTQNLFLLDDSLYEFCRIKLVTT